MSDERKAKSPNKKKERTWTLHPGEILREEYLKPLHMTPYRLARELHVPVPRINDIVLEKRAISADTAVRLAKFSSTTDVLAGDAGRLRCSPGQKVPAKGVGGDYSGQAPEYFGCIGTRNVSKGAKQVSAEAAGQQSSYSKSRNPLRA